MSVVTERLLSIWQNTGRYDKSKGLTGVLDVKDLKYPATRLSVILHANGPAVSKQLRPLSRATDIYSSLLLAYSNAIDTVAPDNPVARLRLYRLKAWLMWTAGPTSDKLEALGIWSDALFEETRSDNVSTALRLEIDQSRVSLFRAACQGLAYGDKRDELFEQCWKLMHVHLPKNTTAMYAIRVNPIWLLGRSNQRAVRQAEAVKAIKDMANKVFHDWSVLSEPKTFMFLKLFCSLMGDFDSFIAACNLGALHFLKAVGTLHHVLVTRSLLRNLKFVHGEESSRQPWKDMQFEHQDWKSDPSVNTSRGDACNECLKSCLYSEVTFSCICCVDVAFHPACHAKLKNGQVDPGICEKDHEFIQVPPLDAARWLDLASAGKVMLGKDVLWQSDSLAGIRKACGVESEDLKRDEAVVQAVRALGKFWRGVRKRRMIETEAERSSVVSTT